MPFTPSHAIVALPFLRTPLIPAAIAIGAMTPDLPLFVRVLVPDYMVTHDLRAIALTATIALVLLLVWRCLLRPAVRPLAPRWLAWRLPCEWDAGARAALRETFPSFLGVIWLVVSLLIGVASHIVWDAFTHEGRVGTALWPALSHPWGPLDGYKWMQYGSTAFGLVVLGIAALVWFVRRRAATGTAPCAPRALQITWWLSLPVFLLSAWIWGLAAFGPLTASFTVRHLAYRVLPPACAVWGVFTLAVCLIAPSLARRAMRSIPQDLIPSDAAR